MVIWVCLVGHSSSHNAVWKLHIYQRIVDDSMPPIIGTAMRCITSEAVPALHIIGNRPAMMAATVISFGRTRSTAPTMMATGVAR